MLSKNLVYAISTPLALIFQKSFDRSELPISWKHADVISIFKNKGCKFSVSNYRPISLTSNICKVFDAIVCEHIITHCHNNNILSKAQHDFRSKHSTITSLIELLNVITKQLGSRNNVDLITINFSKAFDIISHNKLIYKLQKYGIDGKTLFWVKNFFK